MNNEQRNLLQHLYNYSFHRSQHDIIAYNCNDDETNFRIFSRFEIDENMLFNRPKLFCLDCDTLLTPCKNQKFRHQNNTCRKYNQKSKYFKKIEELAMFDMHSLAESLFYLSDYLICPDSTTLDNDLKLFVGFTIHYDNKIIKKDFFVNNIIPDIRIVDKFGKIFYVEIFYKHNIDEEKLDKINNENISILQIDISSIDEYISNNSLFVDYNSFANDCERIIVELKRLLFDEIKNKEWIKLVEINEYINKQYDFLKNNDVLLKNPYTNISKKVIYEYLFFVPKNPISFYEIENINFSELNNYILYNTSHIDIYTKYSEKIILSLYESNIDLFIKSNMNFKSFFDEIDKIDCNPFYVFFKENIFKFTNEQTIFNDIKTTINLLEDLTKINHPYIGTDNDLLQANIKIDTYKLIKLLTTFNIMANKTQIRNILFLCNKIELKNCLLKYFNMPKYTLLQSICCDLNVITPFEIKIANNDYLSNKNNNISNLNTSIKIIGENFDKNDLFLNLDRTKINDNERKNILIKVYSKDNFLNDVLGAIIFGGPIYNKIITILFNDDEEYFSFLFNNGMEKSIKKVYNMIEEYINNVEKVYKNYERILFINKFINKFNEYSFQKLEIIDTKIYDDINKKFPIDDNTMMYTKIKYLQKTYMDIIFRLDFENIIRYIFTEPNITYKYCKLADNALDLSNIIFDIFNDEYYYNCILDISLKILSTTKTDNLCVENINDFKIVFEQRTCIEFIDVENILFNSF